VGETLRRYLFFYLATSLVWDLFRLAGNSLLILAVGAPVLRILRRFHARFDFTYQPRLIEPRVSLAATRNRDSSAAALQGRSG
jgi:hypothetical protein